MARIELVHVKKSYPNGITALDDISFKVENGALFFVLAPVGGGKTVLLNLIAGLEMPDSGHILFDGETPNAELSVRGVSMMFQHYGLNSGLTVYQNLALGLTLRKMGKDEVDARVREAAHELGLTDFLDEKPKKLSALERKKAALARALVRKPHVFLLDDPLGGLYNSERDALQSEILRIHKLSGVTFIGATCEWQDAERLAERMIVLNGGKTMGAGTPQEIYDNPKNLFTAAFSGDPPMNLLKSHLVKPWNGKSGILGFRPEHAHVLSGCASLDDKRICIPATVLAVEQQDNASLAHLKIDGKSSPVLVKGERNAAFESGDVVSLCIDCEQIYVFEESTD